MRFRSSILALLCIGWGSTLVAGTSEYEVKAAYLYNFAKFIDWPRDTQLSSVTICVYGKDPFGGFLDEAVRGKVVRGLPLVIRRLPLGAEISDGCQVLFLGVNGAPRIEPILKQVKGRSIVTISESDGFAERGGMIGLVLDHDRVVFDINLTAFAASGLRASSRPHSLSATTPYWANAGDTFIGAYHSERPQQLLLSG